ncbi:exo-beta-N-acetylmuramidase NamZ domain-containing protein [Algibacter sp. PT7-4]|uniref:exo-beta-N-acetylmuramidase NamZ family protein n=1 Tax=Algibacter ulvanivorans TaxID=3400999 RepID=UPI003AACFC60
MRFNIFKNTVLLFVLVMISCASKAKNTMNSESEIVKLVKTDSMVVVGANQTLAYLPILKGKRVGIIANQTSVIFKTNTSYTHLVDSLISLNVNVKKVFSPEHGFRGKVDAGELVKDGIDTKTNLPIVSLYGKNKKPSKEQLTDLDIVIFDIQDVGVRFYTYISTLHYIMEACAEQNIPVLIFDRPNPNGHYIDGPTLEIENRSFLGMHTIPLVHGMTIGEYAKMINGEKWLKNGVTANINIITIKNYTHNTPYSLAIRPSPNLPNDQSIKLYPSLGLFEGTNVNAGRGTEFQFQRFGAPFLNKEVYKFNYTPIANFGAKHPKHKNSICYGKDLKDDVLNNGMTLKWIIEAYQNATDKSLFFNTDNFTKHAGTHKLQQQIEAGLTENEIKASWKTELENFKNTRKKYLLYL